MPILTIDAVLDPKQPLPAGVASRIADAAAEVLGTASASTWVLIRPIPAANYAENGVDQAPAPLLVSLRQRQPPEAEQRAQQVLDLTRALARACEREMNQIHILYELPAAGRQAFGGQLV